MVLVVERVNVVSRTIHLSSTSTFFTDSILGHS